MKHWPRPETVTQVRKFLGFTNYYRKFLHQYAQIARPLNQLISGDNSKKKRTKIVWTEECESAFVKLKELCSDTLCLAYPDYTNSFKLYTDASESGLGAVLSQVKQDGIERPIAFASRTLSKSERNYDAYKLEFLALRWAVTDRFHEYLYGGSFDVYTDNNLLTYVLSTAKLDAIGQCWVASLAPYNFSLHYNPGRHNVVADSLSRIPWENLVYQDSLDFNVVKAVINKGELNTTACIKPDLLEEKLTLQIHQLVDETAGSLSKSQWKKEQESDVGIHPVLNLVKKNEHLQYKVQKTDPAEMKLILRFCSNLRLVDGLLYRKWVYKEEVTYLQFVLPQKFRKRTILACHDKFGHLGIDKTLVLLQERFFWPKMNEDVCKHIKSCDRCLRFKQSPEQAPMETIEMSYPLELVHMDFLTIGSKKGPTKEINVLVVTDRFTRYAQGFITSSQTAKAVAETFYNGYLVHYGWPERIHSDKGGCFESDLIKELCKIANVQKSRTTPYHPEGNAQVEKFNHTLLRMIGTLDHDQKSKWQDWVSTLTHAYNCTRCESTGFSPYYLMFGRVPRLPIDIEYGITQPQLMEKSQQNYARKLRAKLNWAFKVAKQTSDREAIRQKQYYDRKMRCQKIEPGDLVLVKQKGSSGNYKIDDKWELNPFKVLEQMKSDKGKFTPVFKVEEVVKTGVPRLKTLHRNMLYPYRSVMDGKPPLLVRANVLLDLYFSER